MTIKLILVIATLPSLMMIFITNQMIHHVEEGPVDAVQIIILLVRPVDSIQKGSLLV
jgi:hypothetical protein